MNSMDNSQRTIKLRESLNCCHDNLWFWCPRTYQSSEHFKNYPWEVLWQTTNATSCKKSCLDLQMDRHTCKSLLKSDTPLLLENANTELHVIQSNRKFVWAYGSLQCQKKVQTSRALEAPKLESMRERTCTLSLATSARQPKTRSASALSRALPVS